MATNNVQQIVDRGDLRKYRTELPNLIDDMELSVYAYRLYGRLKRVAGDDGLCWQSTKTLSKACHMSTGMVNKAKMELVDKGLIRVEKKFRDDGGYDSDRISIVDIWLENFLKYSQRTDTPYSSGEKGTPQGEKVSPPSEIPSSPHETKNNPIKNSVLEEGEERPNIFALYEREIGPLTGTITEILIAAEKEYPAEWFPLAFAEAARNNARTWAYVEAILKRWKKEGFRSDNRGRRGGRNSGNDTRNEPKGFAAVRQLMAEEAANGDN